MSETVVLPLALSLEVLERTWGGWSYTVTLGGLTIHHGSLWNSSKMSKDEAVLRAREAVVYRFSEALKEPDWDED